MKKFYSITLLFLILTTGLANAGENLEATSGWREYIHLGTAVFSASGQSLSVYIQDDPATNEAWARWYKNIPSAYGVIADVKIDDYTGNNISLGLRKYAGLTEAGNPVLAEIYINVWNSQNRIMYGVRERDKAGNTLKYFARGVLGDWDGMWNLGDLVTIGVASFGQDIYFYTPGAEAFTKIQLLDGLYPTSDWDSVEFFGSLWNTDGDFTGEVNNVNILK